MAKKISTFFFILGSLLLIGTFLQFAFMFFKDEETSFRTPGDYFDPSLSRLSSLELLEGFVDSIAKSQSIYITNSPEKYAEMADSVVRMRFYYGLQNYKFSENYLTNLAGKYIWFHFGAKVDPDHILQGQKAYCSQSSIVFQELLKRKGIDVRTVRLEGHFCTEVLINGNWNFFDVSYKPDFSDTPRLSTKQLISQPQILHDVYLYSFRKDFLKNLLIYFNPDTISFGKVNEFPAKRMLIFHRTTWFFSYFGWILFFFLGWIFKKPSSKERLNKFI